MSAYDDAQATAGFERVTDDTLATGELRATRLPNGTPLCVGNADGQLFAVRDECPHSGFPLSNGTLLAGGRLECGWHGAQFDCRTGAVLEGPADDPLERHEVRIAEHGIWVRSEAMES